MFGEANANLDTCLTVLPPHLHASALSVIMPEVLSHGVLQIDPTCSVWHRRSSPEGACEATSAVLCALLNAARSFPALSDMHVHVRLDDCGSDSSEPLAVVLPSLASTFSSTLADLPCIQTLSLSGFIREEGMVAAVAALLPGLCELQVFQGIQVLFVMLNASLQTVHTPESSSYFISLACGSTERCRDICLHALGSRSTVYASSCTCSGTERVMVQLSLWCFPSVHWLCSTWWSASSISHGAQQSLGLPFVQILRASTSWHELPGWWPVCLSVRL